MKRNRGSSRRYAQALRRYRDGLKRRAAQWARMVRAARETQ